MYSKMCVMVALSLALFICVDAHLLRYHVVYVPKDLNEDTTTATTTITAASMQFEEHQTVTKHSVKETAENDDEENIGEVAITTENFIKDMRSMYEDREGIMANTCTKGKKRKGLVCVDEKDYDY